MLERKVWMGGRWATDPTARRAMADLTISVLTWPGPEHASQVSGVGVQFCGHAVDPVGHEPVELRGCLWNPMKDNLTVCPREDTA